MRETEVGREGVRTRAREMGRGGGGGKGESERERNRDKNRARRRKLQDDILTDIDSANKNMHAGGGNSRDL